MEYTNYSREASHWDESAEQYTAFAAATGLYRQTAAAMVNLAALEAGMTVVDLACGPGAVTQEIVRRMGDSVRIIAVDFSAEMLSRAERLISSPNVAFVRGRAEELSGLIAGKVDRVLCNAAFWHFDKESALQEMRRILAPDARCLIGLPVHNFKTFDSAGVYRDNKVMWMILEEKTLRGYSGRPPADAAKLSRTIGPEDGDTAGYLAAHGFAIEKAEMLSIGLPPKEHVDFLRIPMMGKSSYLLAGMPAEEVEEILTVVANELEWDKASVPPIEWQVYVLQPASGGSVLY